MTVSLKIFWQGGWFRLITCAPLGSDARCYALPKGADRIAFWEQATGQPLPRGHVLIWESV